MQSSKLKAQLTAAANAVVQQLLESVCAAARESNLRVAEEYAVRLAVKSVSTVDMLLAWHNFTWA